MRISFRKRFVNVPLWMAALPALILLACLAAPSAARADYLPPTVQRPSCLCGADFNGDGLADHGTVSSLQGSNFIHLSLSGKSEPQHLRAGRGIVDVLALDVDRDGDTDLVALRTNLRVRVWLNDGHGKFARRSRADSGISLGNGMRSGGAEQPEAFCCSSLQDDGTDLSDIAPVFAAVGPQPSEAKSFESANRAIEDAFLGATHPRGPPSTF